MSPGMSKLRSALSTARAVLFDLDGTLADTAPDLAGALNQMRIARGKEALPLDLLRPVASAGARGMLKVGLDLAPEHPQFNAAREEFLSNYTACLADRTHLFDGVDALLQALEDRGILWGVVTNKPERFTAPVLAGLGLGARCAVSISGDTTPHPKPHPEPLFEACRRLALEPGQAVYVGDDLRDIQSARAAGMPSVAAAWGYLGDGPAIEAWQADAILQRPVDLTALLMAARP
jgi:N-acetyl-D-muramate 6-phosphate phosphatase